MNVAQPLTIGEHRSDDLVPDLRFHVGELIQDDAIEIRTPQRVWIIGTVETDHRTIDEIDSQVGFIRWLCQQRLCIPSQITPCGVLGLIALREDKGVAAFMLTLIDCATNEVVQRGDRLASTPMADQCGPALLP